MRLYMDDCFTSSRSIFEKKNFAIDSSESEECGQDDMK